LDDADLHDRVPSRPSRSLTPWSVGRFVASVVLAALALYVVAGRRAELSAAGNYLGRIEPGWVVLAIALEAGSVIAFAWLQRALIRSGGVSVPVRTLVAITLAGNSINNSLPAGPAWASYFAFRQYRRQGADATLSAWVLLGVLLASSATLALLAAIGLVVALLSGSGSFGIADTLVSVVLVIVAATMATLALLHRRHALEGALTRVLLLSKRFVRRPSGDPAELAGSVAERLRSLSFSRSASVKSGGWAMANWVTDLGALVASFAAVGVPVPWAGILLAYGAGQLAANLPVTPGGLGVVEGSLEVALVAYGGSQASTVAAVLLYRLVSFWLLLPVGWVAWFGIHLSERRAERMAPSGEHLGMFVGEVEA
jgi:uncharacterized protein (TIRG00374 family)